MLGSWVPQEAITDMFLSYRKCWLRKEAACRKIQRWVFREIFILFDNEVSGSARGHGLYPLDTLILCITAAYRVVVIKRKTIDDLNTPHTDAHFIV